MPESLVWLKPQQVPNHVPISEDEEQLQFLLPAHCEITHTESKMVQKNYFLIKMSVFRVI